MFPDDTNITNSHKSTARFHGEVNHDLNSFQNWPLANQLSLNVLKTDTRSTVYNAVIKPLFDKCDLVRGNLSKTLTTRLQKLQNRAASIIT